jgi:hypothetical protein
MTPVTFLPEVLHRLRLLQQLLASVSPVLLLNSFIKTKSRPQQPGPVLGLMPFSVAEVLAHTILDQLRGWSGYHRRRGRRIGHGTSTRVESNPLVLYMPQFSLIILRLFPQAIHHLPQETMTERSKYLCRPALIHRITICIRADQLTKCRPR